MKPPLAPVASIPAPMYIAPVDMTDEQLGEVIKEINEDYFHPTEIDGTPIGHKTIRFTYPDGKKSVQTTFVHDDLVKHEGDVFEFQQKRLRAVITRKRESTTSLQKFISV